MAVLGVERLLSSIEESLQCGICYEFLSVAMMTPCSHNYCSLCIRKYMTYKSECPRCFKETAEPNLINNRTLDEVVAKFKEVRGKLETMKGLEGFAEQAVNSKRLLDLSRSPTIDSVKRTRKTQSDLSREGSSSGSSRPYRRSSQRQKEKVAADKTLPCIDVQQTIFQSPSLLPHNPSNQDDLSDFIGNHCATVKPSPAERVVCPVCSVDVPAKSISHHVEACLSRTEKREAPRRKNCSNTTRSHLPKLVYRLLSDKELKKKLKDLGLSTIGSRETLIKRHQAFKIAYNAECDSLHPRPVSEIIKQVQKQEDKLSNSQSMAQSVLPFNRKSQPSIIEMEQKKYLAANKSHFDKLINSVRSKPKGNRKTLPKTEPSSIASSSSSDTVVLEFPSSDSENSISLLE